MLKLIKGSKGKGKTKRLINLACESAETATGNIAYITDSAEHSKEISTSIRYFNILDYGSKNDASTVLGFIRGVVASNSDLQKLYFDGLLRITGEHIEDLEEHLLYLDDLSKDTNCDIIMTVSCDVLPININKYVMK